MRQSHHELTSNQGEGGASIALRRSILILLVFTVVGPAVGYEISWLVAARFSLEGLVTGAALSLLGLPIMVAYLIGLPPALSAGATAVIALRFGSAGVYVLVPSVAGGAACLILPWLTEGSHGARIVWPLVFVGVASGLICALLTLRLAGLSLWAERPRWMVQLHAGDVLLGVLILGMVVIAATLLAPALA
jgi:hypothetical protein